MDPEWVRAANEAIDSVADTVTTSEELSGGAPVLNSDWNLGKIDGYFAIFWHI